MRRLVLGLMSASVGAHVCQCWGSCLPEEPKHISDDAEAGHEEGAENGRQHLDLGRALVSGAELWVQGRTLLHVLPLCRPRSNVLPEQFNSILFSKSSKTNCCSSCHRAVVARNFVNEHDWHWEQGLGC
jgi:hypothetical protein